MNPGAPNLVPADRLTDTGVNQSKEANMSTFLWVLLGVVYITLFVALGMSTLRKGHYVLFGFGIIFPLLWIFGALMGPTEQVATAEARAGLQH